jgi:hypothetical protein
VEEFTVLSKKIIQRTIGAVLLLHILLLFDGMPFLQISVSFSCHLFYTLLLRTFPVIGLTDFAFVTSCVLVVADHFMWFAYFTQNRRFSFAEITCFFFICIWLVPFQFFISLSAGDNVLPYANVVVSAKGEGFGDHNRRRGLNLKNVLGWVIDKKNELLPSKSSSNKAF